MNWNEYAQKMTNDLVGCEIVPRLDVGGAENLLVSCRCQDGRILVFWEWWLYVYEFPNGDAFAKAMAEPANDDYLFDVSLSTKSIRLQ